MDKALINELSEVIAFGPRGMEREALRVTASGRISQAPHPKSLGSALTHTYITTDFSEALLEFVTPPLTSLEKAHDFLRDLHAHTQRELGDELLWAGSMPPQFSSPDEIPLAEYGSSNVALLKNIYRRGLCRRYGRTMQAISGVHFNYSLPASFWPAYSKISRSEGHSEDFISDRYFRMIRNIRRYGWLLHYLFGSSPAVCKSFFQENRPNDLEDFDSKTFYLPYATTMRMSDMGYKSNIQARVNVSVNTLDEYVSDLVTAMRVSVPEYEKIGVKVDGEYRQLSDKMLQIENEYYSLVRPKRVARTGQRPTEALCEGGVQYVELRALDVDMFSPTGVSDCSMSFMELFMIYCLLCDSPLISEAEQKMIDANHLLAAREGRKPGLELSCALQGPRPLVGWARQILDDMLPLAEAMDLSFPGTPYTGCWTSQMKKLTDPEQTPSAKIIAEMREKNESYCEMTFRLSQQHRESLLAHEVTPRKNESFLNEAKSSLKRQQEVEAQDQLPFDKYLKDYLG